MANLQTIIIQRKDTAVQGGEGKIFFCYPARENAFAPLTAYSEAGSKKNN